MCPDVNPHESSHMVMLGGSTSSHGSQLVVRLPSAEGEDESEGVVEGLLEGAAEVVCGLVSRSLSMGADSISNNNNNNNNSSSSSSSSSSTNNSSSGSYAPLPSEEGCSQDPATPTTKPTPPPTKRPLPRTRTRTRR